MRSFSALLAVAVVAVATAACSSSSSSKTSSSHPSSTVAAPSAPAYAGPGPYKVGYTTVHMPDRDVAVWYPVDDASVAGMKTTSYTLSDPLPSSMKGLVPPKFNRTVAMNAYAGAAPSAKGPFPVVLFGHGSGGYALANSALDVGIASWGFVVASADYKEYDLAAFAQSKPQPRDANVGTRTMLGSLDAVANSSLLHGAVDTTRVATVGHSLGGLAAFNALNDPRVKVAVGWAPVGPSEPVPPKPVMVIGGGGDTVVKPSEVANVYAKLPGPKRSVEIGGTTAGHNTFTDSCVIIHEGGGLIEFAKSIHVIDDATAREAENGCQANDMAPAAFWRVVQHYTVAEIRNALGIDAQPVGLADDSTASVPGVQIVYQHQP